MNRASFLRRSLVVVGAVAFAPTRIDKVLLPEAAAAPGAVGAPVGTMRQFLGALPDGWMMCDGAAVSKLSHPDLYAVLGTAYGGRRAGRTFRLPDFRGRVVVANPQDHPAVHHHVGLSPLGPGFQVYPIGIKAA